MFDIGWSEMALILAVALVVIGPKDLPRVARQIGRWSAKARSMAREFQRSLDDMAREAELQDIKAEIEKASRDASGFGAELERTIDPDGDLRRTLRPTGGRPSRPAGRDVPLKDTGDREMPLLDHLFGGRPRLMYSALAVF